MCQKGPEDTILSVLYFICVSLFYVSYDWAREVSEDTFDRDEWEFIARYLLLHLIHLNSYSHPHHVFYSLLLLHLSIPSIDSSFIFIVIRIARAFWRRFIHGRAGNIRAELDVILRNFWPVNRGSLSRLGMSPLNIPLVPNKPFRFLLQQCHISWERRTLGGEASVEVAVVPLNEVVGPINTIKTPIRYIQKTPKK